MAGRGTLPRARDRVSPAGWARAKPRSVQGIAEGGLHRPGVQPDVCHRELLPRPLAPRILIYTASTPRVTWPPPDSTTTSTWGSLSPASGARTAPSCRKSIASLNGWTKRRGRSRLEKVFSMTWGCCPHGCGGMRACRPYPHLFDVGRGASPRRDRRNPFYRQLHSLTGGPFPVPR